LTGNTRDQMIKKDRKKAFSLVEILVVIVMISAGILPIYSLIHSGQKRISRADTRILATLFGTSAIELARTLGYDKAQRMVNDEDYQELVATAAKNGFEMEMEQVLHKVEPIPKNATEMYLLRIKITVAPKNRSAIPETAEVPTFMTILTDPRYSYY
jgi:type II secretory pathway pseudopilin PulG